MNTALEPAHLRSRLDGGEREKEKGASVEAPFSFRLRTQAGRPVLLSVFLTVLFAVTLASKSLLHPLLFAGLQVIGVLLDLLDDVFLLDFALEAAQCAF